MGIDITLLRDLCSKTLHQTDFTQLGTLQRGKVRDSYVEGDRRNIVVSDRVSCFDVVVGTIPLKGQVLNQLAAFWFEHTSAIAPNHLVEVPDPNVSVVSECRPLAVEFVYRGYLTGSSPTSVWTAYERGERSYCGHQLPEGMGKHEPLAEPLLTPTTKASRGEHDERSERGNPQRSMGSCPSATRDRPGDELSRLDLLAKLHQVVAQIQGRVVAPRHVFFQSVFDDSAQVTREPLVELGNRSRGILHDRRDD